MSFRRFMLLLPYTSQIVPDIKDALKKMQEKYQNQLPSLISVITGPSRTADIEKTLVMGAHGPKQLYVFLMDESLNIFYNMTDKMKPVFSANDLYKAEIMKEMLAEENIESFILDQKGSDFLIGEVQLFVNEKDEEKASAIISKHKM